MFPRYSTIMKIRVTCVIDNIGRSAIGDMIRTSNKVQNFLLFVTFQFHFLLFQFLKLSLLLFACFMCDKMLINNFQEEQDLLNRAHKKGTHFSYDKKGHKELHIY